METGAPPVRPSALGNSESSTERCPKRLGRAKLGRFLSRDYSGCYLMLQLASN